MKYTIPGDPIPLARCRYGNGRVWDAQKQVKYGCGIQLLNQHNGKPLYSGPLQMDVTFFMAIPKTGAKSKLLGSYHYQRPDLDNLIKFISDVANGILYADDATISFITSKKIYDRDPRIEFIITELKGRQ